MGRRGPHKWAPRSPDLTPTGYFFLRGYTKEEVQITKPCTLEDLDIHLQKAVNNIPNDIFQRVVCSIPGYLRKVVEASGSYL